MKKLLLILLALVVLVGCTAAIEKEQVKYEKITAEEAKRIIDTEEVIILDVRSPEEYEEAHIEGALLIPDYELESLASSMLPDKNKKILIYCRSGNRSKTASHVLIDMGYTQVFDFGGIIDWPYDRIKGK